MSSLAETSTDTGAILRVHSGAANQDTSDYRLYGKGGQYTGVDRWISSTTHTATADYNSGLLGKSDFKTGFTISSGDTVARMNGLTAAGAVTNANNYIASPTSMTFGINYANSTPQPFNGWIREARFYGTRLTDAQLVTLSTNPSTWVMNPATGSQTETTVAVNNLLIIDDYTATKWCVFEQASASAPPATPASGNGCFVSTRPTSVTLTAQGSRKVYVFVQNSSNVVNPNFTTSSITFSSPTLLTFTGPTTVAQNDCSLAMQVTGKDANGYDAPAPSLTTVTLSGGSTFYSDPLCTTSTTTVTIAANATSTPYFYFKSASAGALTLQAAAYSTTANLSMTVIAGVYKISTNGGEWWDTVNDSTCAIVGGTAQCWGMARKTGNITFASENNYNPVTVPVQVSGLTANVTSISTGYRHSCAVMSGSAKCWGDNHYGNLGDASVSYPYSGVPVQVSGLTSNVKQIGASGVGYITLFSCALIGDGVKCWGANNYGQLGNGNFTDYDTPQQVSGLTSGVTAISVGPSVACAIQNGGLKCWGEGGNFALGNGDSSADRNTPQQVVGFTSGVTSVSSELWHVCAVKDGGAYCWGLEYNNSFGDGQDDVQIRLPKRVPGLPFGVTSISAGFRHTCAIVFGGLKCWGDNRQGPRGVSALDNDLQGPLDVPGLTSQVESVTTGPRNTCAVSTSGIIKCFGQNQNGTHGNAVPQIQKIPLSSLNMTGTPSTIIMNANQNCSLLTTGLVSCWGVNHSWTNDSLPVDYPDGGIDGGMSFTKLAFGYGMYAPKCGVKNGKLKCWGGQLYDVLLDINDYYPQTVFNSGTTVTDVAVAYAGFCAIKANAVRCYGNNEFGEIGHTVGTSWWISNGAPRTPIAAASVASVITAGNHHFCAIIGAGGVRCWGNNEFGQLGDGTSGNNKSTPVNVSDITTAIAIGAGDGYSCAVLTGGTAKCWGLNNYGQLGNGNFTNQSTPVTVSGLTGATAIAGKYSHTCAIDSGSVKCWGNNDLGQLGNATPGYGNVSNVPVSVIGITSGTTSIAVGENASCAVVSSTLKCWGSNMKSAALSDGSILWGNDQFSPTLLGTAAKLVITGPASPTTANTCVGPFTVTTKNSSDVTTNITGTALTVNLDKIGNGLFYTAAGCGTTTTSISVGLGTSSQTFYYRNATVQDAGISVSATGLMADGIRHQSN